VKTTELEGVPTSVLIAEVKRRVAELSELKSLMGGTDTDTNGRKSNSKLAAAAKIVGQNGRPTKRSTGIPQGSKTTSAGLKTAKTK